MTNAIIPLWSVFLLNTSFPVHEGNSLNKRQKDVCYDYAHKTIIKTTNFELNQFNYLQYHLKLIIIFRHKSML